MLDYEGPESSTPNLIFLSTRWCQHEQAGSHKNPVAQARGIQKGQLTIGLRIWDGYIVVTFRATRSHKIPDRKGRGVDGWVYSLDWLDLVWTACRLFFWIDQHDGEAATEDRPLCYATRDRRLLR